MDDQTLRTRLIRLAYERPMTRTALLSVLAKEFPTNEALKTYLDLHPKADRSNHSVAKPGGGAKEEEAPTNKEKGDKKKTPAGKGDSKVKNTVSEEDIAKRKPKIDSEDLSKYPADMGADDLDPEHREEIKEYKLTVVGDDARQAVEIARKVKKGIEESADICKMNPPVCEGNMGLTRDKMPQIEGEKTVKQMLRTDEDHIKNDQHKHPTEVGEDGKPKKVPFSKLPEKEQGKLKSGWDLERRKGKAMVQAGADPDSDKNVLQHMIDHLSKNGVKTSETTVSVGSLKATQAEIKADKTFGMADAHLKGNFDKIDDSVIVSRDGHILDGHHRWAALLTIDPAREMKVKVINMDMKDLLQEAQSVPGVYQADFKGDPLEEDKQKDYKTKSKSTFKGEKAKPKSKEKPKSKKATSVRAMTIRLAHSNPTLRPYLLPLIRTRTAGKVSVKTNHGGLPGVSIEDIDGKTP